jgi:RNA polymerase sigma-70 factor (ECF subfamily)
VDLLTKILNNKQDGEILLKKIFSRCYALSMNREDAQDIASETMTKAFERIDQFHGDNIEPWLYTIARNTFLDWKRKHREVLTEEPIELEVLGHAEGVEMSLDLQKCLEKMKEEDSDLLCMIPFSSYAELSLSLEISNQNLRVKISRARNLLADCMEPAA